MILPILLIKINKIFDTRFESIQLTLFTLTFFSSLQGKDGQQLLQKDILFKERGGERRRWEGV